jgi:hypothetical protein
MEERYVILAGAAANSPGVLEPGAAAGYSSMTAYATANPPWVLEPSDAASCAGMTAYATPNPPWVLEPSDAASCASMTAYATAKPPGVLEPGAAAGYASMTAYATTNFDSLLTDALRTKLHSINGTTQSVEFERQVLLALHDSPLQRAQTELVAATLDSQLHFGYAAPLLQRVNYDVDLVVYNDVLFRQDRLSDFLLSSHAFEFSQVLLLHFFSFLIDRVADYWNAVEQARRAWRSSASTFRQLLERALRFKPLHTPSRLIPRSIHPIGSAA